MSDRALTVGELKSLLAPFNDDQELRLPGGLTFRGLRRATATVVYLEVHQTLGQPAAAFQRRNPRVSAVFLDMTSLGDVRREPDVQDIIVS